MPESADRADNPERDVTVGQLLLAEYQIVKDEQKTRIGFRDNLLYVTLTVLAAVIAATAQARQPAMLLALPPVCVVLGWTYLVNDEKISAIGAYVRGDLGPRLARLAGAERVFDWKWNTVPTHGDVPARPYSAGSICWPSASCPSPGSPSTG